MFGKRFSRALAVTTAGTLIMASAAFADNADGDFAAGGNAQNVTAGQAFSLDVELFVIRQSAGNIVKSVSWASSNSGSCGGITAGTASAFGDLPASWQGEAFGTASNDLATPISSSATISGTAGAALGSCTVTYTATPTASYDGLGIPPGNRTVSFVINFVAPSAPANTAPTLTSPGNKSVDEGGTLSFSLSATDPENQTLAYSMTGHRTGTANDMTLNPATGAFSWAPVDNYADYTVTFRATDTGGLYDEKTITISSTNVNPTASLGHDGPKAEGSLVTVTFSGAADASSADTAAGFTYAFACDGSTFETAAAATFTTCTFGDNGTPGIKGRVLDKDGGYTEYTVSPTITNVAPIKGSTSFTFNPYTGVANATVAFSDPGWLDVVTANWSGITGTGTNPQGPRTGTGTAALEGTFTAGQTYTGCLTNAISVRVSDDELDYFDHEIAAANTLGVRTADFKSPLRTGTRNIAKLGNVIPVKLEVLDCYGTPLQGLSLSIKLVKGDVTGEIEEGTVVVDATSVSSADSTNVMREQDGFYMYNLATKGLATGTPFTIQIRDGTMLVKTALIELKK